MTIIALWSLAVYVCGVLFIGYAASQRGRSSATFTLVAILFSPLIAGLCLLVLPAREPVRDGITATDLMRGDVRFR